MSSQKESTVRTLTVALPGVLANGTVCRVIRLDHNAGAAARNVAVEASSPETDWIVMLDDDSHPVESVEPFAATVDRLRERPDSVAAVMADIHLPALGRRESGGLPEVFIGCGVAIRRGAFLAVGGYDASFGYYVEEYDLAARFLQRGWSVAFDPAVAAYRAPYAERLDSLEATGSRTVVELLERIRVRLRLPGDRVYPGEATPHAASAEVDAETGTVTVWAKFPNPDALLRSGMIVTVLSDIHGAEAEQ